MEIVQDKVFGEMFYKHSWRKEQKIVLWGREFVLNIKASAYTGDSILDTQRRNYSQLMENLEDISEKSRECLCKYILENKSNFDLNFKDNEVEKIVFESITPKTVLFKRDGSYGILCDCAWSPDDGIVIRIDDGIKIQSQDTFL